MSVTKNILKNGIANTFQKGIRIAEQLLLVPFFISAWGAAYYGEWLTLTIIPSMLAFSDLGFGSAGANKFMLCYASGDKKGAATTAKSGLFIISMIVVFGILLSVLLVFLLDYFHVFNKSLIVRTDAIWAVLFLMIGRIIGFYQQMFEAYFKAARKAALSVNLQSIYAITNITVGLIVLVLGKGVVLFAFTNLVIALLYNPIYIIVANKTLGLFNLYKGEILKSEIIEIAKNGFGYLLQPVWQAIYFQGTTFVVRLTLGPLAVTVFNTVRTLTRAVNQVFSLVISTTYPEFQFEIGAGNLDKARKLFRLTLSTVIILSIAGISFLYFFGPYLYNIWTNKQLNPPTAMWNIFLVGIAFNAMWWTAITVFQAYNKPYKYALASVISAVISVIASYFLSIRLGLTGAAIGNFILDFLLAFYVLPKACKMLEQPLNKLYVQVFNDLIDIKKLIIKKLN